MEQARHASPAPARRRPSATAEERARALRDVSSNAEPLAQKSAGWPLSEQRTAASAASTASATSSSRHSDASAEPRTTSQPDYLDQDPDPETFEWPKSHPDDDSDDDEPVRHGSTGFRSFARKFGKNFAGNNLVPYEHLGRDHRELQHQTSILVHGGRLFHAPLKNPRAILDLGTGNGTWALTMADSYPQCSVIATDVLPIQPKYKRPNCQFRHHDAIADEWDFNVKFDFIHARCMGWMTDYKTLLPLVSEHLAPGGWAEFQEWVLRLEAPDGSMKGTAMEKMNVLLREAFHRLGKSASHITHYKSVLLGLGFENVTERKYSVPWNTWPPGKQDKKIGGLLSMNMANAISFVSMALLPKALGWTQEATEALVNECLRDIGDTRIHGYLTLMTVYGRKPRERPRSPSPPPTEFLAL